MTNGVRFRDVIKQRFPFLSPLYQAVRYRERVPPFRRRYALGPLHEEVKRIVAGRRGGFFIEAGALDGLYQSNTAYLEAYLGWRGILVEALPPKVAACRRNRPKSDVVHCGLVSSAYSKPYLELQDFDAMSVAAAISDVDVAERLQHHTGESARILAPARTLDSVLAEFGYPAVDLFSLDVEGAELEVLRGIDFTRAELRNIVVETEHIDAVTALLRSAGYRLAKQLTFHDYHFAHDG